MYDESITEGARSPKTQPNIRSFGKNQPTLSGLSLKLNEANEKPSVTMETPRAKYTTGPSSPLKIITSPTATPIFGQPTERTPVNMSASTVTSPTRSSRPGHSAFSKYSNLANFDYDTNGTGDSFATSTPVNASSTAQRKGLSHHRHSPSMPDLNATVGTTMGNLAAASPLDVFKSGHGRSGSANSNNSDVQGIVARFNRLEIRDGSHLGGAGSGGNMASPLEKSRSGREDVLAVKRAEMAREVAEEEARKNRDERRRLKEELDMERAKGREDVRRLRKEVEEGRDRERRLVKRLDLIMVSYQSFSALL